EAKFKKKIRELEKADIIVRLKDDAGNEHVLLKSNPKVATVYPEWLIQSTVESYSEEDIPSRQAIHYLEVLKHSHPSMAAAFEVGESD
ncbi:MAG: hypothetical protein ACFFH0_08750, partial [Promethearchaeota archaeon]